MGQVAKPIARRFGFLTTLDHHRFDGQWCQASIERKPKRNGVVPFHAHILVTHWPHIDDFPDPTPTQTFYTFTFRVSVGSHWQWISTSFSKQFRRDGRH